VNCVDSYRRKATDLRLQACSEPNVSTRLDLELLAVGYERLAEQAERNAQNNTVYEYDPEAIERRRKQQQDPPAQKQQQQQQQPQARPKRPE
jgi:hypothetical protein